MACFSCKKEQIVNSPDFDVTLDKTTYAVGAPVTFNFTGDVDIISFYSGVAGSEYKFRDRFRVDGKPQIQFTSYYQASTQTNTLQLMLSKDFNGNYDAENLKKATWTDITSRATLSTGTDNTPSGVVDLTDLQTTDVPVYIAFKYNGSNASAQPTWTIKNIAIDNKLADGSSVSIASTANLTWGAISVLNSAKIWTYSTTQLQFVTSTAGTDDNEDWLITKPLQLDRVQRSFGINIKGNPTTKQTTYTFPGYTTAGTYTVTFEAINANKWDKKTTLKEFTVTVQ
jgi:hypothetical protein